jgi:hypothetical protein
MQIGVACDSTTNGSNCHRRTASRIAPLKAGKGGVSRAWRIVQMWLTLPSVSSSISPIHIPLPRVPGGSSGYFGLTSRTFFGARCHPCSIRGFDPTNRAPSRSQALEISARCAVGSAVVNHRPTVAAPTNPASLRLVKLPRFPVVPSEDRLSSIRPLDSDAHRKLVRQAQAGYLQFLRPRGGAEPSSKPRRRPLQSHISWQRGWVHRTGSDVRPGCGC